MTQRALVLGIGNVLWADEGFGMRCVETLAEQWAFDDTVQNPAGGTQSLMQGGTLGDAFADLQAAP